MHSLSSAAGDTVLTTHQAPNLHAKLQTDRTENYAVCTVYISTPHLKNRNKSLSCIIHHTHTEPIYCFILTKQLNLNQAKYFPFHIKYLQCD